jgi:hypothetical protein
VLQTPTNSIDRDNVPAAAADTGVWTTVTSLTKQRVRLNMRLLGQFGSTAGTPSMKEDKPTYREQFVPPDMSMVSYFLMKVRRIIIISCHIINNSSKRLGSNSIIGFYF